MVKNHRKFETIAISSSLNDKRVTFIANQLEEILNNLNIKCLFPKSSKIGGKSKTKLVSDRTVKNSADLLIAIGETVLCSVQLETLDIIIFLF